MTDALQGAFKAVALPPLSLFVLIVIGGGLSRRYPRIGRALVSLAILLLYGLSTPYIGAQLSRSLQSDPALPSVLSNQKAGAIVILSGDLYSDSPEYQGDTVGRLTLERLRYGARLARQIHLPILVTGGQPDYANRTLADAMQESLTQDFHTPARWLETQSLNTYENAQYSARILQDQGIDRVYLVTHSVHMRRAKSAFKLFGVDVIPAPTRFATTPTPEFSDFLPTPEALTVSCYAVYEWIGRLWYAFVYV